MYDGNNGYVAWVWLDVEVRGKGFQSSLAVAQGK